MSVFAWIAFLETSTWKFFGAFNRDDLNRPCHTAGYNLALSLLLVAVDVAHDRWLFARWQELSPADLDQAADRIADTLQRLLAPH